MDCLQRLHSTVKQPIVIGILLGRAWQYNGRNRQEEATKCNADSVREQAVTAAATCIQHPSKVALKLARHVFATSLRGQATLHTYGLRRRPNLKLQVRKCKRRSSFGGRSRAPPVPLEVYARPVRALKRSQSTDLKWSFKAKASSTTMRPTYTAMSGM